MSENQKESKRGTSNLLGERIYSIVVFKILKIQYFCIVGGRVTK